jgi:uncharacterized membrane protein
MSVDIETVRQKVEDAVRKMHEVVKAIREAKPEKAAAVLALPAQASVARAQSAAVTPYEAVSIIIYLLAAGFAVLAAAYIISLLIHKRMIDAVQSAAAATFTATQALIATSIYYGAYERSETLRTVAAVIGVDQIRDTALQFQNRPFGSRNTEQFGAAK